MQVDARRILYRVRGGSRAHLLTADDGHDYVVKFVNNPQGGTRILINEWIGGMILRHLGIACCITAVVTVDKRRLEQASCSSDSCNLEATIPERGEHFGSRHPGTAVGVYDFLPDPVLKNVENLPDFIGVLAIDKWTGNVDARQAVFLRGRLREYVPALAPHPLKMGWVSLMIDNGHLFNGPSWDFPDVAASGLYFRPGVVYRGVRNMDSFQPWLDGIMTFSPDVLNRALRELPHSWTEGDMGHLERLLERLISRRRRVPDMLRACARGPWNPFPDWDA